MKFGSKYKLIFQELSLSLYLYSLLCSLICVIFCFGCIVFISFEFSQFASKWDFSWIFNVFSVKNARKMSNILERFSLNLAQWNFFKFQWLFCHDFNPWKSLENIKKSRKCSLIDTKTSANFNNFSLIAS